MIIDDKFGLEPSRVMTAMMGEVGGTARWQYDSSKGGPSQLPPHHNNKQDHNNSWSFYAQKPIQMGLQVQDHGQRIPAQYYHNKNPFGKPQAEVDFACVYNL